ncbi:hypothetical protein FXB40_23180 [Bradyrhizobium rifense]|uniref:Uncharacterized protein n=1 Tax=Bradyrhizobium rifense TaxID=515499 RepID=A0A5D3KDE3_9BRAD|nr:hypothetical protein [Bradyrhizobium rifense]TYL92900.1 hypothetical protein FXB40_23180 [Bradyrhizobium rifense]
MLLFARVAIAPLFLYSGVGKVMAFTATAGAATHTQTVRGFAPTARKITFVTIDIWRVEGEKFAEH